MIADIFESVTESVTGLISAMGSGIAEAVKLVYTPGTSGNPGQLTVFGTFCLIAVGAGIAYWCFRLLRSLIHLRG